MNTYNIKSYLGADPILLGMKQADVRAALGVACKSFLKTKASEFPTDAFTSLGIHVYYKNPGICKAIEFHPPSIPLLDGQELINQPASRAIDFLYARDNAIKIKMSSVTSMMLGIDLFIPDLDESKDAPVKAVLVFEHGYK